MLDLITVTPNPAIDRSYDLPADFRLGEVFRAGRIGLGAGGKGVNVARVAKRLGIGAYATGFLGERNGASFRQLLSDEGLEHGFIDVAGECRLSIILLDSAKHRQTVINEAGPQVSEGEWAALIERICDLAKPDAWVALCGSVPPGCPTDLYARLIERLRGIGARTAVDSSGEPLRLAAQARPDLIKTNLSELSGVGLSDLGASELGKAAKDVRKRFGVKMVAVTAGSDGAVLASENGTFLAGTPAVDVVSAVGSGDSFLAGMLAGLICHLGDEQLALRRAVACGAANAMTELAGDVDPEQIADLSGKIRIDIVNGDGARM
jgi:1-phosphofructokinase family hexose kinase